MNIKKDKNNKTLSGKAAIHPVTLSFNSTALQQAFARYHIQESLKLIRIGLVLGLVLYMLYSLLDRFIVPQTAPHIFIMRIVVSPFFLLVNFVIIKKFKRIAILLINGHPQQDDMTFLAIKMKQTRSAVPLCTARRGA